MPLDESTTFNRPDPQPLQFSDHDSNGDIYRGSVPSDLRTVTPDNITVSSSTSSSSSSTSTASIRLVQRALATVVELAISRWARHSPSTDDGSSSSSTSTHPSSTRRRRSRRRPRRASVSTVSIDPAQIAQARDASERARRVPRDFHLVLPYPPSRSRGIQQRVLHTANISTILSRLELAMKRSSRPQKEKQSRFQRESAVPISPRTLALQNVSPTRIEEDIRRRRLKQPRQLVRPSIGLSNQQDGGFGQGRSAWWLDVASPTWEDMRAIGTVRRDSQLSIFVATFILILYAAPAPSSSHP